VAARAAWRQHWPAGTYRPMTASPTVEPMAGPADPRGPRPADQPDI